MSRLKFNTFSKALLVACLFSSIAVTKVAPSLWREITESQAKNLALPIPSWAPLVERAQPAVVVITTEAVIEQQPMEFRGLPGPFRFYLPIPPERQRGQGSGFIINDEGYILTNQHVIEGAQKIKVIVGKNPREYEAEVLGADEALDIALIKLKTDKNDKTKWPYLPLGDSEKLRLGEPVMALGSPLGLIQSVNTGIVSQKQRGGIKPSGRELFVELIQLQMPINPGNSGGPVVDTAGRVVGISESILASGQSIAFCLPINIIKDVINQLKQNGQVQKAFLGVEPTDLSPENAKALGLPQNTEGAVVVEVISDTPAARAGLMPMDVILKIDDQDVKDSFNLRQNTAYKGVGKTINLTIYRKGVGKLTKKVKLESRPGQKVMANKQISTKPNLVFIESVGLEVRDTPKQVQIDLRLNSKFPGAEIVNVRNWPNEEFKNLKQQDVITKVGDTLVKSANHLKLIIDKVPSGTTLLLSTRRGDSPRFVPLKKR